LLTVSEALNRLYFPENHAFYRVTRKMKTLAAPVDSLIARGSHFESYLLASRIMVMPHQMLQPHPTRQKRTVNNWPTPTMRLTMKAPSRDFIPATAENLGCPVHRLNKPLQTVPWADFEQLSENMIR